MRIAGTLTGRVEAKTIAVDPTAKVQGDLLHEILSIEAGAAIEGNLRRLGGGEARTGETSNVANIAAAAGPYGGPGKAAAD